MNKVQQFLSLLFVNDKETCEEIYNELKEIERVSLEEFFENEKELFNWIVQFKGVPFPGEEDEYDLLVTKIDFRANPIGCETFNKILDVC